MTCLMCCWIFEIELHVEVRGLVSVTVLSVHPLFIYFFSPFSFSSSFFSLCCQPNQIWLANAILLCFISYVFIFWWHVYHGVCRRTLKTSPTCSLPGRSLSSPRSSTASTYIVNAARSIGMLLGGIFFGKFACMAIKVYAISWSLRQSLA